MSEPRLQQDNHYVSQGYLRRFSRANGCVWCYRTLVPDCRVPLWKPCSTKGVAFHRHLYTKIALGFETDEFEKWLNREFESPAEEAIRKAISDEPLTPSDWQSLIRFLAVHDVRTPARLIERFQKWPNMLPGLIQGSLTRTVKRMEQALETGRQIEVSKEPSSDDLPCRITTEFAPGEPTGKLKAEILSGRSLWLSEMRHLLTTTLNTLHRHRWTILKPPHGLSWITSDDPVIRLNFYGNGKFDFKGGWGSSGTEIIFPLSPQHLLYTKVGKRAPLRGTIVPRDQAKLIRKAIAEHAHRMIFSAIEDGDVPQLRPRDVSEAIFLHEKAQWEKWHDEQSDAEMKF